MKKIIVFILCLFLLVGCTKEIVTLNEFVEVATFNGYIITSSMDNYEKYNYIDNVVYAINREEAYFIQFIEIKDIEYAKKFFEYNRDDILQNKKYNSYSKSYENTNYSLYHLETDEDYRLVIRSMNNIIYVDAPINYINEIESFLQELNIDY